MTLMGPAHDTSWTSHRSIVHDFEAVPGFAFGQLQILYLLVLVRTPSRLHHFPRQTASSPNTSKIAAPICKRSRSRGSCEKFEVNVYIKGIYFINTTVYTRGTNLNNTWNYKSWKRKKKSLWACVNRFRFLPTSWEVDLRSNRWHKSA